MADNKNKPWVSNYPPLAEWLEKHNARCMWQLANPPRPDDDDGDWEPNSYIECHFVGGRPVLIQIYNNEKGWDIYSALDTVNIDATFKDVEERVGIKR